MPNLDDAVTWRDLLPVLEELGVKDRVLARLQAPAPAPLPYETPELKPLGNLNDLLAAGGSQQCDAGVFSPGVGVDNTSC